MLTFNGLHTLISQKMELFKTTAVNFNPTQKTVVLSLCLSFKIMQLKVLNVYLRNYMSTIFTVCIPVCIAYHIVKLLNYPSNNNKQTNSVALSPSLSARANYTDRTTATCWRNLVPTFVDRWVSHGQHGGSPTVVNLSFLDRSRYFSFK
jgi:hypothetical protein